ncbi:uncharacterized protein LOC134542230 isoform X1 [Bacillus rossius redtenbacheri]|uniref:uncharacterized protein LOC134542230 isoform X1 n=2 Tax=Bacillus rossius redtenbacheri TaxID=93214 RepID=UPI002FDD4CBD
MKNSFLEFQLVSNSEHSINHGSETAETIPKIRENSFSDAEHFRGDDVFTSNEDDRTLEITDTNTNKLEFRMEGRRIVDLGYLVDSIMSIGRHYPFDCTFSDMKLINEKRLGFCSVLTFKCLMCNMIKHVRTEKPDQAAELMNVNAAVVSGVVTTGGGYSQLEEMCASVSMPCISRDTWQVYHGQVSESINKTLQDVMREAGAEEAELAKAAGEVDKDGIPLIVVVADGAWAKRSYKTKYDALSGVGAIIGYRTKKVLFVGVRNKYCSICDRQLEEGKSVKSHKCAKNWDGPSSSMEQDIIVEGFLQSVSMHGLKYHKLIGDGDSSVHRKLIDCMPYGPTLPIQKIECRNHILRNYANKIRDVCKNNKLGDVHLRNSVLSKIKRLRTAVVSGIKYRKAQINIYQHLRVTELKKDILNSPYHVFGDHSCCQERNYFCDGSSKPGEVNIVPLLKETSILDELQVAVQRVAHNASSLIYDVDNNVSELFNSIIAKTVGGKRVNFSLRDSYQTRCNAAAISMNAKSDLHRLIHKTSVKRSPGIHTKKFIERRRKRMENSKRRRLNFKKSKKNKNSGATFSEANDDYGLGASEIQEDMTN